MANKSKTTRTARPKTARATTARSRATTAASSKNSALQRGALTNGAAKNGAAKNGALTNGAAKNGAAKNGAAKNGAAKRGAAKRGAGRRAPATRARGASHSRSAEPVWASYSDDELLDMRICDLKVSVETSPLAARVDRLYRELAQRGIGIRPHCWFSDEWFSPDDIPGIAIPFYLAHRRLQRLERSQVLEVEGGGEEWCMRILRHEAGHAVDTSFQLNRKRNWQRVFGKASTPYPDYYRARPASRNYVLHLESWYAQSHPAEDFAETFAVWLKPRSSWRVQYQGWPAIDKLEYVDQLIDSLRGQKPKVRSRCRVEPVRKIRKTLREHYEEKRSRYGLGGETFYDFDLQKLFSSAPEFSKSKSAASFLNRTRKELREVVADWTGQHQYTIDQILSEMIDRSRELRLRLDRPWDIAKRDAQVMLTVQTMNYLLRGHHKIAL